MRGDESRVVALSLALTWVLAACSLNDLDETRGNPADASVASGGADGGGAGGVVGSGGFPGAGGSSAGSAGNGGNAGGGASGGGGGAAGCGVGEKLCGTACVAKGASNGCDAASCAPCSIQNGKATCVGGSCAVGACNAGFADCDQSAQNGCETALGSSAHCASCTDACSAPTGTAACVGGACKITACPTLRADCDGLAGNGCESDLTTPATCSSCTNKCAAAFDCVKSPSGQYICACSSDASCLNGGTCYLGVCVCGGNACAFNQRCTLIGTCF